MKILLAIISFVVLIASVASVNAACTPYNFPNGSKVSFANNAQLMADFAQMSQGGAIGSYDWAITLCDANTQPVGAPACAKGYYMTQDAQCGVIMPKPAAISTTPDGGTLVFTYPAAIQANGFTWTNVVTCVCDRSASGLTSTTNGYFAAVQGTQVTGTWRLNSPGCCIDGSAPPPGPGGDNSDSGSGGLPWGGVFLLIFFLPLGLYVIGFVAWNYKQGKTGKDLAPHPEFWGALPSLAKDGIMFIVSKIRGTPFVPSESGSSSSSSAGATGAGGDAGVYSSV